MIKAIFLDFDGTIYSHKTKCIPQSAHKAILKAQANGIKVFLSTGRSLKEVKIFNYLNINYDGYVLDNGQLILDKEYNIIDACYIEGTEKEKIVKLFNEKKQPVMFRTMDDGYMNFVNQKVVDAFKDVDTAVPPIKEYNNEEILVATVFINSEQEREDLKKKFTNLNATWWHIISADLVSKGNDKMTGINKLLKFYNIEKDSVMAIGDGDNDIEMISKCMVGVAMGNAIKEVKDIADYITDDIDNDGLEKAFKKYNVI